MCTDCTLPFYYSFVFVPMQKLDLWRCCTYTAMQEHAIFDATADLQQQVGEQLMEHFTQYLILPSSGQSHSSPSQISILTAETPFIATPDY